MTNLTQKEKNLKREGFISWITFIDDRVNEWKTTISIDIANQLDWSIKSLSVLEKYILETYQLETVHALENKQAVDAMASYIGEVYRQHFPNARWYMELDVKTDIDFGCPVVRMPLGAAISSYPLVIRVLHEKSGQFYQQLYDARIARMRKHGMI